MRKTEIHFIANNVGNNFIGNNVDVRLACLITYMKMGYKNECGRKKSTNMM